MVCVPWVNPRHGPGPRAPVAALANRGTKNYKLSTYIPYQGCGYSKQAINNVNIVFYDRKINVLQSLCILVLDWYHLYLNLPGGSRRAKTIQEVCYWKVLATQSELCAKLCNICQKFKNRKTLYECLTPNSIT